jgi:signal transduction histidine kinase
LQLQNQISPNLETARQGIYGYTQMLGLATWGLTFLTFFLTDVEGIGIALWLSFGLVVWIGARLIDSQLISNSIQFFSMTLILGTPLFFESANESRWIPITVIAIALVAILAIQVENRLIIVFVLTFIGGIKILIDLDLYSYLYGGAAYKSGAISLLYLCVVGFVTWLMKRITFKQAIAFDQAINARALELEAVRKDQIDREIDQSIARRLHESVLNTFTAISRMTNTDLLPEIKKIVRRDLESLDQISNEIRPISLADLIEEALIRTTINRDLVKIFPGLEVEVSVRTYTPLIESATEALRNIERHSNANQITISWKLVDQQILFEIADNGEGFNFEEEKSRSFGLRVVNHHELKSMGHAVRVKSTIGSGTTVQWSLTEYKPMQKILTQAQDWPKLTEDNLAFRFLFLIVPLFFATLANTLAQNFLDSNQVVLSFLGYVTVLAIYAVVNRIWLRFSVLAVLLILIYWGQLNLIGQTDNCTDALPIQWLMNGYTIGILLVLLSAIPIWMKILILLGNFFVIGMVAHSLGKCQEIALLPGLTGFIVASGLIYGLAKLRKSNLRSISNVENSLNNVLELQHRQDATDLAHLRLRIVTKDARVLLESLLTASDDSDFAYFQQQCKMQESYLRSALLIIQTMRVETQQNLLDILSQLANNNVQVSIESWTENLNFIIWPDPVIEFGYKFSEEFKDGTCKLMFFEENNQIILVVEANGQTSESYAGYDFIETLTTDHLRAREVIGTIFDTSKQTEIQPLQSSALR